MTINWTIFISAYLTVTMDTIQQCLQSVKIDRQDPSKKYIWESMTVPDDCRWRELRRRRRGGRCSRVVAGRIAAWTAAGSSPSGRWWCSRDCARSAIATRHRRSCGTAAAESGSCTTTPRDLPTTTPNNMKKIIYHATKEKAIALITSSRFDSNPRQAAELTDWEMFLSLYLSWLCFGSSNPAGYTNSSKCELQRVAINSRLSSSYARSTILLI